VAARARLLAKLQQEKAEARVPTTCDPLLLKFHADHHAKLLCEHDDPKKRTFRVKDIKWLPKKNTGSPSAWSLSFLPMENGKLPAACALALQQTIPCLRSSPVSKKSALEDFFLVDATDPDPGNVQHCVWVGEHTEAHAKR
jgi:hypothetical protein